MADYEGLRGNHDKRRDTAFRINEARAKKRGDKQKSFRTQDYQVEGSPF